ncbi:hypothetical protein EDC01DRAFT_777017 [Geopyxis carbonaria]|nr:hypothetical protein EDC01DRAFT_777017 [Geopyxis carbonaria]
MCAPQSPRAPVSALPVQHGVFDLCISWSENVWNKVVFTRASELELQLELELEVLGGGRRRDGSFIRTFIAIAARLDSRLRSPPRTCTPHRTARMEVVCGVDLPCSPKLRSSGIRLSSPSPSPFPVPSDGVVGVVGVVGDRLVLSFLPSRGAQGKRAIYSHIKVTSARQCLRVPKPQPSAIALRNLRRVHLISASLLHPQSTPELTDPATSTAPFGTSPPYHLTYTTSPSTAGQRPTTHAPTTTSHLQPPPDVPPPAAFAYCYSLSRSIHPSIPPHRTAPRDLLRRDTCVTEARSETDRKIGWHSLLGAPYTACRR